MAEAFVEERQLLKSMHWYDGFVIAVCAIRGSRSARSASLCPRLGLSGR